jgi:hypothetical protein
MLEHLFGSKTRLKLLKIFFRDPGSSFYVRELTRILDVQINAIRRELEILIKTDLIKEMDINSVNRYDSMEKSSARLRKYYSLNMESILYPEMKELLVKAQILGEQKFVQDIKEKAGDIKLFILTGHFTGDTKAPSDMLLVGKIKEMTVNKIIKKYEKEFGFEIRFTLMSEEEFTDRRHVMDKFLFSIFETNNVKVIDKIGL